MFLLGSGEHHVSGPHCLLLSCRACAVVKQIHPGLRAVLDHGFGRFSIDGDRLSYEFIRSGDGGVADHVKLLAQVHGVGCSAFMASRRTASVPDTDAVLASAQPDFASHRLPSHVFWAERLDTETDLYTERKPAKLRVGSLLVCGGVTDEWLRRPLDLGADLLRVVAMDLHELGKVELGRPEHLDLADAGVLQRVDALACLLNVLANRLGDQLGDQLLDVARRRLAGHNLRHLLVDLLDLGRLRVARLLDLALTLLGECKAEHAQRVAVGGLDVHVGLDQRLPLAHQRAQLVGGEVHAL
eukprot:356944-Chlamydomonas_euryale.AAC.2